MISSSVLGLGQPVSTSPITSSETSSDDTKGNPEEMIIHVEINQASWTFDEMLTSHKIIQIPSNNSLSIKMLGEHCPLFCFDIPDSYNYFLYNFPESGVYRFTIVQNKKKEKCLQVQWKEKTKFIDMGSRYHWGSIENYHAI